MHGALKGNLLHNEVQRDTKFFSSKMVVIYNRLG